MPRGRAQQFARLANGANQELHPSERLASPSANGRQKKRRFSPAESMLSEATRYANTRIEASNTRAVDTDNLRSQVGAPEASATLNESATSHTAFSSVENDENIYRQFEKTGPNGEHAQELLAAVTLPLPVLPASSRLYSPSEQPKRSRSESQGIDSSEAETEHLSHAPNDDSSPSRTETRQMVFDEPPYDDDIPEDLDNLSDTLNNSPMSITSSQNRDPSMEDNVDDEHDSDRYPHGSQRSSEAEEENSADELDAAVLAARRFENPDEDEEERNSAIEEDIDDIGEKSRNEDQLVNSDGEQKNVMQGLEDQQHSDQQHSDQQHSDQHLPRRPEPLQTTPDRKRKRGLDAPFHSPKRPAIAPRKVQAELDSDEELDGTLLVTETSKDKSTTVQDDLARPDVFGVDDQESEEDEESEQPQDISAEGEEAEDEVQDETEREERNRHRQEAMDALRQIEMNFTQLRSRLYEERSVQVDRELALAESGQHPLLLETAKKNRTRHARRVERATIRRDKLKIMVDLEHRAKLFMAHSQFSQEKQKLRATLLSRTSAEWFQIHREKRVLDMAVPDYGYVVPSRKLTQARHRREVDAEIGVLAGLKKFVGFPAAPTISITSTKEANADFAEMGLKNTLMASKETTRTSSYTTQIHPTSKHISQHTHNSQNSATSANTKSHHHHHHHQHLKHASNSSKIHSPQISSPQAFQTHSYQAEPAPSTGSRKQHTLPATFGGTSQPVVHSALESRKQRDQDRLPFPTALPYHSSFQAPSLPRQLNEKHPQSLHKILRMDSGEKPIVPNLPMSLPINDVLKHHSFVEGVHDHSRKPFPSFWTSQLSDPRASALNSPTLAYNGQETHGVPDLQSNSPKAFTPLISSQNGAYNSQMDNSSTSKSKQSLPAILSYQGQNSSTPSVLFQPSSALTSKQFPSPQQQQQQTDHRVIFGPPPPPNFVKPSAPPHT